MRDEMPKPRDTYSELGRVKYNATAYHESMYFTGFTRGFVSACVCITVIVTMLRWLGII